MRCDRVGLVVQSGEFIVVHLSLTHSRSRTSTLASEARIRTAVSATRLEISIPRGAIVEPGCTRDSTTFQLHTVWKSMHELALDALRKNPAQPEPAQSTVTIVAKSVVRPSSLLSREVPAHTTAPHT